MAATPQTPQQWTLKIELQGEVRRLRGWPELEAEPTVEALRSAVCELFDLNLEQREALTLKYQDDEGDLCTLMEASLLDALSFASQRGILRLTATLKFSEASASIVEPRLAELMSPPQLPEASWTAEAEPVVVEPSLPSEAAGTDNVRWMCPTCDEPNREERSVCNNCGVARAAQVETAPPSEGADADPAPEVEPSTPSKPSFSEHFAEAQRDVLEQLSEAHRGASELLEDARPHVAEVAASVSEHFADAHRKVSEQLSQAQHNVSEQLSEAQVPEQLSEAHRVARDHLEGVRPRVAEGVAYFKQQVIEDFQSTSQDMQDAFGPNETETSGMVRVVVGTAAGLIAAVRLAPLRATRLAVHSVAAVAGKDTPSDDADGVEERQTITSNAHEASSAEFAHFKQQVKNDFQSTQKEVHTAFNCIFGESTVAVSPSAADSDQAPTTCEPTREQDHPQQQPATLQTAIPVVVSTVVGGSIALCLSPLRAATFAVASLANSIAPQAGAAEVADQ